MLYHESKLNLCLENSPKNCGRDSGSACASFASSAATTPAIGARSNAKSSSLRATRTRSALGPGNSASSPARTTGSHSSNTPPWTPAASRIRFSKTKNLPHNCPFSSGHSPAKNPRGKTWKNSWAPSKGLAGRDRPAQIQSAIHSQGAYLAGSRSVGWAGPRRWFDDRNVSRPERQRGSRERPHGLAHASSRVASRVRGQKELVFIGSSRVHGT